MPSQLPLAPRPKLSALGPEYEHSARASGWAGDVILEAVRLRMGTGLHPGALGLITAWVGAQRPLKAKPLNTRPG